MAEVRTDLKERIRRTGHTIADLCRASNGQLPYQRVSGFLNGLWDLNLKQDYTLRKIVRHWEEEEK